MDESRREPEKASDRWWVVAQVPLLALAVFLPLWFRIPARNRAERLVHGGGAALLLFGAGMVLAASISLGRQLTPFPRPRDHAHLREHGIYGLARHPLYGGLILATTGWSMWTLSWPGAVSVLLLGLFLDRKASYEEGWLTRRFDTYAGYRERVRKLIPWIY